MSSRHPGAAAVSNSPYSVLPHIFAGRIGPNDVLVDVGCGKGRVINWWVSQGLRNRMVGIELEPEVAAATARRLRRFPNVTIVNADATTAVPDDATLLYLYSPFDRPTMQRLKSDIEQRFAPRAASLPCTGTPMPPMSSRTTRAGPCRSSSLATSATRASAERTAGTRWCSCGRADRVIVCLVTFAGTSGGQRATASRHVE